MGINFSMRFLLPKDDTPKYMGLIQIAPKKHIEQERTQKTTPSLNKNPTILQN